MSSRYPMDSRSNLSSAPNPTSSAQPLTTLKRKTNAYDENVNSGASLVASGPGNSPNQPFKKMKFEIIIDNRRWKLAPKQHTVPVAPKPSHRAAPLSKSSRLCPRWNPIPGKADRESVEQQVFLREFIYRFQRQLAVTKVHLDALDTFDPITEPTCKALLLSLLQLVYQDESQGESKNKLGKALTNLRRGRVNLDDMWNTIQDLDDCFTCNLAEPASKDTLDESLLMRRTTRTGPQDVIHANQLIPVLSSLAVEALHTSVIRQELDDGMKETTRLNKEKFNDLKEETERWTILRNDLQDQKTTDHSATEKLRVAREVHNLNLKGLRVHHNVLLQSHVLRFGPLGSDDEGRIYYALSHPAAKFTSKGKRKSSVQSDPLDNWACFVFAWGKKPSDAHATEDRDEADEDDVNLERWWAFTSAESVRALSKWLMMRATEKDEREDASDQVALAIHPEHSGTSSAEAFRSRSSPPPMEPLIPLPVNRSTASASIASIPSVARKHHTSNVNAVRVLCRGLNDFADILEVKCGIDF